MGRLTQCNYCSMQQYLQRAKRINREVTKLPTKGTWGGFDIFMHPLSVTKKDLKEHKHLRERYFVSWMMSIPNNCICDG